MTNTTVNINISESDLFKEIIVFTKNILEDNRVPEDIKREIKEKIENISNHNNSEYKIFTKDDYRKYCLSNSHYKNIYRSTHNAINEAWDNISKGYNFIIATGKGDDYMFYSVEYFSNTVLV